jgi:hypothetical protein
MSLRVDVVLAAPVDDERIRYQLARAIASLGPPAPDFSTAQRALEDPRPVLARGLSKLAARHLLEALTDFGIAATAETAGTVASRRPSGKRRLATWATLGVVMAGTVFVATRQESPPTRPAASSHRPSLAQARSIPWSMPSSSLSLKDLSTLVTPSIVEIRCRDRRSTGFFVARDAILTRAVATEGCSTVEVATGGAAREGAVTQQDPWLGLALVRATGAEPLRLGDAASLQGGDRIVIAGSTVREGRMGTAASQLHGIACLLMEGEVRPGDAGAPVLDERGYVIGMAVPPEEMGGASCFLPINYVYEESHLLESPPGADSKRWKALLAEVELAEKLRVEPSPDSPQSPSTPLSSTQ